METALFHNFTNKDFTGYWDGKPKTFKAGQQVLMPKGLAEHFAKHLANEILVSRGMYNYTSPKFPAQVPKFLELFDQACIAQDDGTEKTETDVEIAVANQNHGPVSMNIPESKKEPQIIDVPDDGDDEEVAVTTGGANSEAEKEGFQA